MGESAYGTGSYGKAGRRAACAVTSARVVEVRLVPATKQVGERDRSRSCRDSMTSSCRLVTSGNFSQLGREGSAVAETSGG